VQLNIGVVDKQGRPVTSLTQKDFVVYEDGVKQSIPALRTGRRAFQSRVDARHVRLDDQLSPAVETREPAFLDALAPEDRVPSFSSIKT
jgi:hypothetical protein